MKDAIAMFMICVSSLERVEGQYPVGSDSKLAVYHGERLIIGGLQADVYGQEFVEEILLTSTTGDNDREEVKWVDSDNTTKMANKSTGIHADGLCNVFNHTTIAPEGQTQDPPFMPGYTICGKRTQLTVYVRHCPGGMHFKTIGHCDNSSKSITQCQTVRSAKYDTVHATTSHYRLTPCNFTTLDPNPFATDDYQGPHGVRPGEKGKNVDELKLKQRWQNDVIGLGHTSKSHAIDGTDGVVVSSGDIDNSRFVGHR